MDRRKTNDFWAKLLFFLNIGAWLLLLLILLVFNRAQPEFETFFDRFYHLKLRTDWDYQYLYYLVHIVSFGIIFCVSGLVLSIFRGRRKTDHKRILIFTGIFSALMLLGAATLL